MTTPLSGPAGIFVGNPAGSSNYTIAYQGNATESKVKSLLMNEDLFELKNPTIQTGTTSTNTVTRQTGATTDIVVPTEAISLTITAVGGGGGGGGGQSDISSTSVSGVVGVAGGATTASVSNSLGNVSAAGGAGGLSGSNISAGSGAGVSGSYGTGGAQGSAGNVGGAGGHASVIVSGNETSFGAGGGGSGSRNYGGWLNSGQDAVTNGGGGQAGSVHVTGPHDVSSLGAITISSISIGAGNAGGNGNAANAGGTGTAGKIIVTYTTTSLTDVHLMTTDFGFNAVGTYAFANSIFNTTQSAGTTVSGSNLRATNARASSASFLAANSGDNEMTGLWRRMGYVIDPYDDGQTTLFLKIS